MTGGLEGFQSEVAAVGGDVLSSDSPPHRVSKELPVVKTRKRSWQKVKRVDSPCISTEWRPMPGFSKYEVGNAGEMRRIETGRVLRACRTARARDRLHVTLMNDDNLPRSVTLQIAVCLAFHGEKPSPRHQAAHRNGDPNDNRSGNLRWATPEENQADRILHNTDVRGEEVHGSKLKEEQIPIIRRLLGLHVPYKVVAHAFQVDTNAIFLIGKGHTWAHVE
jgi:HNH endonuclease